MHETAAKSGVAIPCGAHGEGAWLGDIKCLVCDRVYLATEVDERWIYDEVQDGGYCACGAALFPKAAFGRGAFTARPICDHCAMLCRWQKRSTGAIDGTMSHGGQGT